MDPVTFKAVMASFPSGVSVVTVLDDAGRPRGLTCSSLCSVSLEPPTLLVCVHNGSETLHSLHERGSFAVNMLTDNSAAIAKVFASKSQEKFAHLAWRPAPYAAGAPILIDDIVAHAECRISHSISVGDHCIFLGVVEHGESYPSRIPLVYLRRRFETLAGHHGASGVMAN